MTAFDPITTAYASPFRSPHAWKFYAAYRNSIGNATRRKSLEGCMGPPLVSVPHVDPATSWRGQCDTSHPRLGLAFHFDSLCRISERKYLPEGCRTPRSIHSGSRRRHPQFSEYHSRLARQIGHPRRHRADRWAMEYLHRGSRARRASGRTARYTVPVHRIARVD